MRILIAPNAMKGSMSAADFADAIGAGLLLADSTLELLKYPLADGGDGTAEVLIKTLGGIFVPVQVHDPLGREITCCFGWLEQSGCAVIEMAEASGLRLLSSTELNPMVASSRGTGELIVAAVNQGAQKIILGIGGSATVDGGIGMLKALGFLLLDRDGVEINDGGEGLIQLAEISSGRVKGEILTCEIVIASDVVNSLLGKNGAASIFGPQKGATAEMVINLEMGFHNYIRVLEQTSHMELKEMVGGGAAGGIALPLVAFLNARMVSGAELIIDLMGVVKELENCDLVITGEGCIDLQTCQGKGAAVIAQAAHKAGVPVIAIGGSVREEASWLFDGVFSITSGPSTLEETMSNAFNMTRLLSFELGKFLKIWSK